ncbi:hypothetical protein P4H83_05675 [Paenibacillus favisporus]|nr:hypothetical protein [Paenibacillus favisporus]MEC0174354.1 hypothetical protein [Paenibacillus favisporus]
MNLVVKGERKKVMVKKLIKWKGKGILLTELLRVGDHKCNIHRIGVTGRIGRDREKDEKEDT